MSSRSTIIRSTPVWLAGLTATALGSCAPPEREPLPDWSEGAESAPPIDPVDPEVIEPFALRPVTDMGYETRLRETRTANNPCEIEPDGTTLGYQEIDCTLDINELDLYGNGLDFDFSVPYGACEFVVYWHYMYEAWEVGEGPTDVSWDVDLTGNISNEVNAVGGVPYCEYDYGWRSPDFPNCCTGSYTVTITNTDTGQVTTTPPQYWGGNPADCYDGAAFWDPEASPAEDGWPMAKIIFTRERAWTKRFHFDALSSTYYTNVVLANYFDPLEHAPLGAPAGLLGDFAQPYYTFQCFDHAEELLGEIRLVVKEWNEEVEFYADAEPDTTGVEPVSGHPINDRMDWADATPGSDDYIEYRQ